MLWAQDEHHLHGLGPLLLVGCRKGGVLLQLAHRAKRLDQHADEEVDEAHCAHHHPRDHEERLGGLRVARGRHIDAHGVHARKHNPGPPLERRHFEKEQRRSADIVEGAEGGRHPLTAHLLAREARHAAGSTVTAGELATEELHTEHGEDGEEEAVDHGDVKHTGRRVEQQRGDELHAWDHREQPQRPQHAQHAQHTEGRRRDREDREERGGDDEGVELVPAGCHVGQPTERDHLDE